MKHAYNRLISMVLILLCLVPSAQAYSKLQRNDSGPDVLNMQLALQYLGYTVNPDGKYGANTAATVKSFQREYGLKVDGIAGDKTLSLLYAMAPQYAPQIPSPGYAYPTAVPQQNTDSGTAVVTGGRLILRAGPSAASTPVLEIPDGASVQVITRSGTWTSVLYNGMAGYVMTQYLAFGGSAPVVRPTTAPYAYPTAAPVIPQTGTAVTATVATPSGSLNLRESPDGSARVIASIPKGAVITVTARGDVWSAVLYNNMMGYVMTQYLSFGAAQSIITPTPVPTYAPVAVPTQAPAYLYGETAWVSTSGGSLNFRESASGTARVLSTIPNGYRLEILSRGDVWCMARYNGTTGFVMTAFLRFDSYLPTALPTQAPTYPPAYGASSVAYVSTSGGSLNLREAAQGNARILLRIPNGAQVTVTSRGSAWCAVVYQGVAGYVMTSFLSFSAAAPTPVPALPTQAPAATAAPQPAQTAVSALVTTSGGTLNLREQASANARVLTAMPNASNVTVYSRGETWSYLSYNGLRGYALTQYLTFLGGAMPVREEDVEVEDPSKYTRTLRKGMTGGDVSWVQSRLIELGYSLTLTNLYDDATFAAVKSFQTQNGLNADGLAGSQTFTVLRSDSARRAGASPLSYTTLRIDNSGDGVKKVQTDLKALGYNVKVNGTYDVDTHNAVVAFQQRNGLVISGVADSLTRQLLHGGGGLPYSTPVQELPANEGWIQGPSVGELKLLHWVNDIKPTVKTGQTFTVFDPNTHLSWKLVFYSLGRHADSQPLSFKDTQIMNRSFGSTSWTIHPVYVLLPTGQWTMATMHNRPHLYGSIDDNGFGGHLCVHFLRDMAEARNNDPNYGVNNQTTLRSAWKALTGETVN